MSQSKQFALKRITKDYKEIQQNPVNGVGICQLDPNDPFQFLVNIKVVSGGYKDLLFHILLILPEQYPCKPPRMLILPGQPYDHSFHHHIYPENDGYFKFCIDLLDKAIMNSSAIGSGWSPGYTFCTLLMQIQNFLADPDFSPQENKNAFARAPQILKKVQSYSYTHKVGNQTFVHSTSKPYPPLQIVEHKQADLKGTLLNQVKERVSCFIMKENIVENPTGIYGYPLFVQRDKFNRLQQKPIPEILSLEGFQSQLQQYGINGFNVNHGITFKTGMGEAYNAFLPIFLNKQHFQQSRHILKECLAAISNSEHLEMQVLQVLPNLISKMVVALLNDSMHQSISAIEAYVHFTQLFHYLVEDNPSIAKEVDLRVKAMIQSDKSRSKQELGDIGEFLVVLTASQYALTPSLINVLYREYFARQIFWIPKNQEQYVAYLKQLNNPLSLNNVFQSALVSNKLLIFNIEASKKFAEDKEYLNKLANERYSVIPEEDAVKFIKETNQMIKNINNHVKLMDYLGLGDIYNTNQSCYNLFKIAIYVSNNQRYTNFNISLTNGKGTPDTLQIQGDYTQPIIKVSDLVLKSEYIKQKKVSTVQTEAKNNENQSQKIKQQINKTQMQEEEKVNLDQEPMEEEEPEDEWHTISNSKSKASNTNKTEQQTTNKQVVKPDLKVQKQTNNSTTSNIVKQNKLVSSSNNQTIKVEQEVKKDNKNEADEWNVVPEKKKKN
ncbi:ubiquitin-conjugating enzyme (macronuclear) [Tetrahymena thermophila SB210]|uniref:Ubiquitin-conjugating enzyme n=1 Tax=Tetrahymena thermophila (strain SB210) TaxID=312017 RepID=I7M3P8_TETTS|nr:ubiquitin-conjugating enzyme [Tetrahymena thermophila SB210]EAS03864.1 ubiquitin-conjugating enzyme [Tetrahymena thermophila SB210]|eukprot:XP_001024109.1 ubiquitin-conjugating enzyme [Tetrahymena thermophila SB210]